MLDLNFQAIEISLTDTKGVKHMLSGQSPEAQVASFKIYESVESTTLMAEMTVVDTAINLISSVPLVGSEQVTLKLKTPNISDTIYEYNFVIYGIRSRTSSKNYQQYTLDLFSEEALTNETVRVGKTFAGSGDIIAKRVLSEYLQTKKDTTTNFEVCKFPMKLIPSLKRPFEVITQILPECISAATNPQQQPLSSNTPKSSKPKEGKTDTGYDSTITGSAGYYFFETYDGYVFKSIDSLISAPVKHKRYAQALAQDEQSNAKTNAFKILSYSFGSEINILKKMRHGVYSSLLQTFNPSTLEYTEKLFVLDEDYSNQKHLGKEETIPDNIKSLAQSPSRILVQMIDQETYYNGASNGTTNSQFKDYRAYTLAQSISRNAILENQVLNINIPCNLDLRAGDKIDILLRNQVVTSLTSSKGAYDEQFSGTYLIKSISYEFYSDRGGIAVSNVQIIRDNFGSK